MLSPSQGEVDSETLKTITKDEVLSLLKTYIHPDSPTRSKISLHLCSQQTPSPRVSLKAADALLVHFKAAGIPVKEAEFNAAAAMQLSVAVHQAAWVNYFEVDDPTFDKKVAKHLVELIATVAKQYPVKEDGEGTATLREGAVYIDDLAALKSRLMLSKAATPVENYSDLTGSKL